MGSTKRKINAARARAAAAERLLDSTIRDWQKDHAELERLRKIVNESLDIVEEQKRILNMDLGLTT